MNYPNIANAILQEITTEDWKKRNLQVLVKRDDLIHEEISGNKWRKLLYNVAHVKNLKKDTIITFGGAFSNHLVATANACQQIGIKAIGIIRGEELTAKSNDTLKRCAAYGMELVFVSRSTYQLRYDYEWWKELQIDYPNSYVVPEGGANYYGILGCQEIWKELPSDTDRIFVGQGTTTTSCGILLGAPENCAVHVVPVLKGFDVHKEMKQLLTSFFLEEEDIATYFEQLRIEDDFHFGGYGKYTSELLQFISDKYREHQLKLDPIYTGKVFFAMEETIQRLNLQNEKIIFLHTGGIQGAKSIEEREKISLYL